MSFLGGIGGIGGGRRPVPKSPTADNRKVEKSQGVSSVIKSAKWGRNRAGINDTVSINVALNKLAMNANAKIEIFFHSAGAKPHPFDTPISIKVSGLNATGNWQTKAPKMQNWTNGHFTFRVWVDGETMTSDELRLTNDPVARVVRRISTDGFDR